MTLEEEFKGNFRWDHGIIRQDNSLTSRDSSPSIYFGNLNELQQSLAEQKSFYRDAGYKIWFSHIKEWNPETKHYEEK
jgi:hypothetical protein